MEANESTRVAEPTIPARHLIAADAAHREERTGPLEQELPEVVDFARDLETSGSPLVRRLAFLLRHGGPAHGVGVDAEGWAELSDVARALKSKGRPCRAPWSWSTPARVNGNPSTANQVAVR